MTESASTKKSKERTCVACRTKGEAEHMLRFVRRNDGEVVWDRPRTAFGRGANLCPRERCLELAIERKAFNRSFKKAILVDKRVLENVVFQKTGVVGFEKTRIDVQRASVFGFLGVFNG